MNNMDDEEIPDVIKDLFGNPKEPPPNTIEQDYPGLFPNWK